MNTESIWTAILIFSVVMIISRMGLQLRVLYLTAIKRTLAFAQLPGTYPSTESIPFSPVRAFLPGSGALPFTWWWQTQVTFVEAGMHVEHRGATALVPWRCLSYDCTFFLWSIVQVVPQGTVLVLVRPLMRRGAMRRIRLGQRQRAKPAA